MRDTTEINIAFEPVDNARLSNLCGAFDENLRQIETALEVNIARRGERFTITGPQAGLARGVLERFYLEAKHDITLERLQLGLIESMKPNLPDAQSESVPLLMTRKSEVRGRTVRQNEYLQAIQEHDITFSVGPAGTGKTYLAVASAVDALQRETVKRLVLVRPAVEAGERLGFLPGDMKEKVDPYLRPLYDALHDMMPAEQVIRRLNSGEIEVAPLAFMRGRTLAHAYAILDEAQNTTPMQMKMFLTRMGEGTRMVITGDLSQVDLPPGTRSGLRDALETVEGVPGIGVTRFDNRDVVRHPLVARIVDAYDQRDAAAGEKRREVRASRAGSAGQADR